MSGRILLIEDEPGLVLTLTDLLSSEGYTVDSEFDGRGGLSKALSPLAPDLIILDVMLPGLSGFEVCAELRRRNFPGPILMLTARGTTLDKVQGLKLGADDYLTKPFDPLELMARVQALLRRASGSVNVPPVYEFSDKRIDFARCELTVNSETMPVAGKELDLLRYFIQNPNRVISRDELLREVWNYNESVSSRTIDVHIAWLRQKIQDNSQAPRRLQTVRGVGYRFVP